MVARMTLSFWLPNALFLAGPTLHRRLGVSSVGILFTDPSAAATLPISNSIMAQRTISHAQVTGEVARVIWSIPGPGGSVFEASDRL